MGRPLWCSWCDQSIDSQAGAVPSRCPLCDEPALWWTIPPEQRERVSRRPVPEPLMPERGPDPLVKWELNDLEKGFLRRLRISAD